MYKLKCMKETMLKPIKFQAGLDSKEFTTNRVESTYNLLKLETGGPSSIELCIKKIRSLVDSQGL